MAFFQHIILQKAIGELDIDSLNSAWQKFSACFHNTDKQANIAHSKEEQYQEGFLRDLFVDVFGYTLNPEPNFNLTTELKNIGNSKKVDGAILKNGDAIAVIELKGMDTTDLGKVEAQAFGYKNNQPHCRYVITANFAKLRFYIDNAVEHIEFDLFHLDKDDFAVLFLLLNKDNLLADVPAQLKSQSISQEQTITEQLYKDYTAFKRDLFNDLMAKNSEFDKLQLFKKSQKLLDRLLFIFFAEDRLLLPANFAHNIIAEWEQLKQLKMPVPLYERIKQYFGYLDKGYHDDSTHIFAYNGGLFATDSVLDNLIISDEVLHPHIKKLAEYDFASEVDVNILGHIFENSLNEIEEIQNQLQGISTDKKQSKRKKDGVFYTPKYITKYIVENTVGKLCTDKKSELGIIDEDFYKPKRLTAKAKEIIKSQADKLTAYRSWLLQLTICDPACGSGAFLNEALNFLIAEHRYIDELTAKLYGDSLVYQDVENSILENNLFGVDINEESVDIAKLSLWLRTAKPKRKLSSLNNNIKCGNSLISDKAIGGEKAFDWQKEFPQVFAKGGFDVVIGNPPYVKLEQIKQISEQLEQMNYQTYAKRGDLYVLFVEKGFELLKTGGFVSYIMPNKWLQADYGKYLRKYFLENNIFELIDFGDLQIFEGATTYPCIFNSQKDKPNDTIKTAILNKNFKNDFNENIKQNEQILATSEFDENTWVISSAKDKAILDKVCAKFEKLSDFVDEANYGVKTGFSKAFFIDEIKKNEIINEDMISSKIIFPFVQGRDISRYGYTNIENYLIGTFPAFSLNIDEFIGVKNHLLSFGKERLEQSGKKGSRKKTTNKWFETSDSINYYKSFEEPKIMYQKFQVKPCFIFDESGLYCNDSMWIIPTDNKGLLAILNSKMGWWLISKYCTQIQNGYQLIWKYFGQIPIAPPNNELAEKADKMLILNKDLQTISGKFIRTLQRKFEILEKLPKKLENWYELNFAEFVKELNKKKIKLTLSEESDWEDFFLTEQKKALSVQREITITDKEIDTMVYRLYDLTDEEITIIEG